MIGIHTQSRKVKEKGKTMPEIEIRAKVNQRTSSLV